MRPGDRGPQGVRDQFKAIVPAAKVIGGDLHFEAEDLDAAIELAARIPAARMGGAVEVRPIVEW